MKYLKFHFFCFLLILILACNTDIDPNDLSNIPYLVSDPYPLVIPKGLPSLSNDINNPITKAGVLLGRHLFYDPILSSDSTISCSSCHQVAFGFTDGKALSPGVAGTLGNRSSMSLINAAYFTNGLFWDGRAANLEFQALQPIENPVEMHENWPHVEEKLQKNKDYPSLFRAAFGISNKTEIKKELASKALAQFERILLTGGNSLYQKQLRGEYAFSVDQTDGMEMYLNLNPRLPDAQCGHCHAPPLFASSNYFNNGLDSVGSLNEFKDKGRGAINNSPNDIGKFKAPGLMNIHLSAPYMHDGRFKTLDEVLLHYTTQVKPASNLDPNVANVRISSKQAQQVLIFLMTLIDTSYVQNQDIYSPF
ncbi:MAG: cytochrome c peroxidase [Saprospiraceae bacterium]